MPRRVIASNERSLADAALSANDPERGARRREVTLLTGFAIVFVMGVWTVVAAELVSDAPATRAAPVLQATQKPGGSSP